MKVLITAPMYCSEQMKDVMEYAYQSFDEVVLNPYRRTMSHEEIASLWSDVDAVIAGVEQWDADFIQTAPPSMKIIARNGIGYDNVDISAAAARGIVVTVTREANSDSVADCTIALMLALARHIIPMDQAVRSGNWGYTVADDLFEKTIGILGFGAIGQRIAKRAAGFSMNILAHDPYLPGDRFAALGAKKAGTEEIYRNADFVVCTGPLTKERYHMINAETLAMMKPTAYLVNTARGGLVDEDALYHALKANQIAGAGLDVFNEEPLRQSPLFELENVVFLPHLGGHSKGATHNMGRMNIDNILAVSTGKPCKNIVAP
ncbi:D-3-phosphoglycerate dehydrogenase [Oscillibacter sp. PC13]|uniref:phosphoglycerate dehydrogenase n=1 Tax=Oscillibacter sp. PC13 TaxID=1855299 RepID=UPI0008EDF90D|nr:phosphoglycerate dehydrogenase [Oscillibacter sp. PC13]SFP37497.1 D-3-phosphoglycerate dehydrogenase [Oscillibacter sp. PC13]